MVELKKIQYVVSTKEFRVSFQSFKMKAQYKFKKFELMSKTSTRVRDAGSGKFVPSEEAAKRPKTTVTEKVKVGPVKKRS